MRVSPAPDTPISHAPSAPTTVIIGTTSTLTMTSNFLHAPPSSLIPPTSIVILHEPNNDDSDYAPNNGPLMPGNSTHYIIECIASLTVLLDYIQIVMINAFTFAFHSTELARE